MQCWTVWTVWPGDGTGVRVSAVASVTPVLNWFQPHSEHTHQRSDYITVSCNLQTFIPDKNCSNNHNRSSCQITVKYFVCIETSSSYWILQCNSKSIMLCNYYSNCGLWLQKTWFSVDLCHLAVNVYRNCTQNSDLQLDPNLIIINNLVF